MKKPDGYDAWFEGKLLPVPETSKFFAKYRPITLHDEFSFEMGCAWSNVIGHLLEENDIHAYFKNVWYLNEVANFDFSSLNQINVSRLHKDITQEQSQKIKEYNRINPEKPLPLPNSGWGACNTNQTKRDFIKIYNERNAYRHDFLPIPPFGRFIIKGLYDAYVGIANHIDDGTPLPNRKPKWERGNLRLEYYRWLNFTSLAESERTMNLIAAALAYPVIGYDLGVLRDDSLLPALHCDGGQKHREFVEKYEKRFNPQAFNLQAELRKPKSQRQPETPFLQFPTFDNIQTPTSTQETLWDFWQKNKGNGK